MSLLSVSCGQKLPHLTALKTAMPEPTAAVTTAPPTTSSTSVSTAEATPSSSVSQKTTSDKGPSKYDVGTFSGRGDHEIPQSCG